MHCLRCLDSFFLKWFFYVFFFFLLKFHLEILLNTIFVYAIFLNLWRYLLHISHNSSVIIVVILHSMKSRYRLSIGLIKLSFCTHYLDVSDARWWWILSVCCSSIKDKISHCPWSLIYLSKNRQRFSLYYKWYILALNHM